MYHLAGTLVLAEMIISGLDIESATSWLGNTRNATIELSWVVAVQLFPKIIASLLCLVIEKGDKYYVFHFFQYFGLFRIFC